jgi:MraZ protein
VARKTNLADGAVAVDKRGRVVLPERFRRVLGSTFVLARGPVKQICLYRPERWEEITDRVLGSNAAIWGANPYARHIIGSAEEEVELDPQHRFVIPQRLMKVAKIENAVEFYKIGDVIEMWSPEEFALSSENPAAYCRDEREDYERYIIGKGATNG